MFKKHALRLGQSLNLPEDHLSFECDFMAVLAERTKERLAEGDDAEALLHAALAAHPRKVVIKRPPKGPWLADVKPSYSLEGKAVRYDVIAR